MKKLCLALLLPLASAATMHSENPSPRTIGKEIQELAASVNPGEKAVIILLLDAFLRENLTEKQRAEVQRIISQNSKDAIERVMKLVIPTLELAHPDIAAGLQSLGLQLTPGVAVIGLISLPPQSSPQLVKRLADLGIDLSHLANIDQLAKAVPGIKKMYRDGVLFMGSPENQKVMMQLHNQKQYRVIYFPDPAQLIAQGMQTP